MTKPVFLMLVGLPASGKSTLSSELIEDRDDIVYVSSDSIRKELFGSEDNQDNNQIVFEEMTKRTKEGLKNGKNVLYDATNLNKKRRKGLLQQLPKETVKNVVYMATGYHNIKIQNTQRERVVPEDVIERMYKTLQLPVYSEGWDNISFCYDDETLNTEYPKQFSEAVRAEVLFNRDGYDLMRFLSAHFKEFTRVYDMPQDSKYHSFSVGRHIYYVYRHVLENYHTDDQKDKEVMLWAALLHDIGKYETKSFKNRKGADTKYANFIGHEFVSSQNAVLILKKLGFDDSFIHKVSTLIQDHMYLLNEDANRQKLMDYVGEDLYRKLEFLRDADTQAH